ncbi:MAG: heparinase II/III family protein [Bacteroidales bacterium]|nr:heparinase II/III family protein [Bacteroidales bacterium]
MKKLLTITALLVTLVSCQTQPEAVVEGKALPDHPRLLYTRADQARVGKLAKMAPQLRNLQEAIVAQADGIVKGEELTSEKVDLSFSRAWVNRMLALGIAYRQTGDSKYSDQIGKSLNYLCSFETWHPEHYLDVAEMTTAVAIAYDWCYDVLSEKTRQTVREAIYNKALTLVLNEYENGDEVGSWAKRETNWNVVCNTGMVLGALAVAEDFPQETGIIVRNAEKYMPNCLRFFDPDGVCYEGPGYYEYTNIYLAMALKALEDNFGNTGGLSALPGISKTAQYYVDCVSPSGRVFNFADSGSDAASMSPLFFYFSRKFNLPEVAGWYRGQLEKALARKTLPAWHFPLSLAWYDDTPFDNSAPKTRIKTFHNVNDILMLRGSQDNPKSIHVLAKGGDPDMAHQQADGGSFVIESEGERWLDELGCDAYDIPSFFTYAPDAPRWGYFRESSLSHNTISLDGLCQYSRGTAHFADENLDGDQPGATFEMTSLYPGAQSVTRGFTLASDTSLLVTDHVEAKGKHDLRWIGATRASVEVNGSEVILSNNGKQFKIKVLKPEGAGFTTEPAKPFTQYEKDLEGITMIHCDIHFTDKAETVVELKSLD